MRYPFCLYDPETVHKPIFTGLSGTPYVADMSYKNPLFSEIDVRDQKAFQEILRKEMGDSFTWGISPYLERRDSLLSSYPKIADDGRFFHLGLDVIVPLGATLHSPLDAVVYKAGYEEGEGNYGGYVCLEHRSGRFETFYSFYGHLSRSTLPMENAEYRAGEVFANIGDFHENGNWFHHTHIQVITREGMCKDYLSKGYCSEYDLGDLNDLCPSPMQLFKI